MNNLPYFLALNRIPQIGPRSVKKLLLRWPYLGDLFKESKTTLCALGLSEATAEAIVQFNFDTIQQDLDFQSKSAQYILTWEDSNYPSVLKEIYDPPTVIFAKGNLNGLSSPMLAMVGSRKPSPSGSHTAHRFAFELASQGLCIVSGLALGIDAQAHQGALDAQGQTIAVLGTGVNKIYPYRHQALSEQIAQNGLVISEFPLNTAPNAGHFPRRNRIISGLSLATLVVEAAIKSGSLITARLALEQNRDVFAIPGSIHSGQAQGCNHLIKQGAALVTTSQDVLVNLGLNINEPCLVKKTTPKVKSDEAALLAYIGYELTSVEDMIQQSGLSVTEVNSELATLEIQGCISAVAGGYVRCIT